MQEHEHWIAFAKQDLSDAKILLRNKSFLSATYHCQQSAEKALKSYLISKKMAIVKTHDLIKLGALCKQLDKDFEKLTDALEKLNPFSTKFRYPSEFDLPDRDDTKIVIKQAKNVLIFVTKKISAKMLDQMEIL